jgi:TrpR-related protein YerC/YecD
MNTSALSLVKKAFFSLKTEEDIEHFLEDLMTPKEILEFSKRILAAEMLQKKIPYTEITEKTGLSSTTIARVAKCLHGDKQGYQKVIKKESF